MFRDMWSELRGSGGQFPVPLAQTYINRALRKIQDESTWSFQLGESGWITPGLITAGTVTTNIGNTNVVGNATAAAAWAALPAPYLITQLQFRLPAYAIYNIVGLTGGNTLVLDRPWMEPAGASQTYQMYQAYFPAPVKDFRRWMVVIDKTNAAKLWHTRYKQTDLQHMDPQRTIFQNPTDVVPYETDMRANTSTPGYMLFELWPHQLAKNFPYYLYYVRSGPLLLKGTDTVPEPLTEELVIWRAKVMLYEWKASQMGEDVKRGSGADWKFLMQAADAEFKERLKDIRKIDRDRVDNFVTRILRRVPSRGAPFFSAITGQASVGV